MFKPLTDKRYLFTAFVQTACIGHCVFEYLCDLVTVSLSFDAPIFKSQINYISNYHLQTTGPSMEPTLHTNSILVTERISKRFQIFDRGDIVIAKSPIEPKMMICKRIVGLPGDKILIKPRITLNPFGSTKSEVNQDDKSVNEIMPMLYDDDDDDGFDTDKSKHINNQESAMRTFRSRMIYVPKGHVWLEGDNSENSIDSRTYGPVPIGLIQSRAAFRLYPEPTVF